MGTEELCKACFFPYYTEEEKTLIDVRGMKAEALFPSYK